MGFSLSPLHHGLLSGLVRRSAGLRCQTMDWQYALSFNWISWFLNRFLTYNVHTVPELSTVCGYRPPA
jgi:hypothetical protein